MTDKLDNDQLRHLYFDNNSQVRSFRERKNIYKHNSTRESFFDTDINYSRLNDIEINKYEALVNSNLYKSKARFQNEDDLFDRLNSTDKETVMAKLYNRAPLFKDLDAIAVIDESYYQNISLDTLDFDTDVDEPIISQLEKDLLAIEFQNYEDSPLMIEEDDYVFGSKFEAIAKGSKANEVHTDEDDDLAYLDSLVNSGIGGQSLLDSHQICNLFAEIVGNEKEAISNYESEVFEANVKMLFDEVDEQADVEVTDALEGIGKISEPGNPEDAVKPAIKAKPMDAESEPEKVQTAPNNKASVPEKTVKYPLDAIAPVAKPKLPRLKFFDILLILVILAILFVIFLFLYPLLDFSLPFELPFMEWFD